MADTRVAPKSAKAAGRPDFSGYWRQIKNENMDAFLQVLSDGLHRVHAAFNAVYTKCSWQSSGFARQGESLLYDVRIYTQRSMQ